MNYSVTDLRKEEYQKKKEIPGTTLYQCQVIIKEIEDTVTVAEFVSDHDPTEIDYEEVYSKHLELVRESKLLSINSYDTSESVNSFEINGIITWLDKATRVGLNNSLSIEKESGREQTTLYLNNNPIIVSIDTALHILSELELYAIECYRQTEVHKAAVKSFNTIQEIEEYDHTSGYPQHPVFNLN